MTSADLGPTAVQRAFDRRREPGLALAGEAGRVAQACYDMAVRFHRGGKLLAFGNGGQATDAQHVAVEFVHPVIVGKRALPAMSLASDPATITGIATTDGLEQVFATQVRLHGAAADIALGISFDGRCASVLHGLRAASELGMLTVALVGGDGGPIAAGQVVDHVLHAHADDPRIVKEIHVTIYHIVWELVHVFFEQPGLLGPEVIR